MINLFTKLIETFKDPKTLFKAGLGLLCLTFIAVVMGGILIGIFSLIYRIDPIVWVQSSIKSGEIGLVDFEGSFEDLADDKRQALVAAENEVFYVGTVFYRTLQENREAVLDSIRKGAKVRFLIADPKGKYWEANSSFFTQSPSELAGEWQRTVDGYVSVQNTISADHSYDRGMIELRYIDAVFPNAYYFYDPESPKGSLLMTVRDFGNNATEMPGFKFLKTNSGVLERYHTSVKELWNHAKPYEPDAP